MKKKLYAFLCVGCTLCACGSAPESQEDTAYKTLTVQQEDRTLQSEYSARLDGQQVVEVRPQVSGLITQICFKEGQQIRKGQILFILGQVPYKAAVAVAEATVQNAEAQLATAQLNMKSTEVKSPVDGVAGIINYRVGALVDSNITEPLVTVSDDSQMYAYFSLTEGLVIDLQEQYGSLDAFLRKMPDVSLRMSNGKIYPEKGRISAVSGIVTAGTGAVTLRADFPNPQNLLLSRGDRARP